MQFLDYYSLVDWIYFIQSFIIAQIVSKDSDVAAQLVKWITRLNGNKKELYSNSLRKGETCANS